MSAVFELLMLTSLLGAVDVLYYHLYRFRLYERLESMAEEITHLTRHVLFLGITAIVTFGGGTRESAMLLWGLFAGDFVNNVIDVLLERRSRATLGGLPSAEYLIHILANFLTGLTVATYYWHSLPTATPLSQVQIGRGVMTIVLAALLLLIESSLFLRAVTRRKHYSLLEQG